MADSFSLTAVDHDPFGELSYTPVDSDPFAEAKLYASTLPDESPVTKFVTPDQAPPIDVPAYNPFSSSMEFSDPISQQNYENSVKEKFSQLPLSPDQKYYTDSSIPLVQRVADAVYRAPGNTLAGMIKGAWNAATLPGDVATGAVNPTSPGALERSTNLAGLMQSGAPAEEGAVGAGWSEPAKHYLKEQADKISDDVTHPSWDPFKQFDIDNISKLQPNEPGIAWLNPDSQQIHDMAKKWHDTDWSDQAYDYFNHSLDSLKNDPEDYSDEIEHLQNLKASTPNGAKDYLQDNPFYDEAMAIHSGEQSFKLKQPANSKVTLPTAFNPKDFDNWTPEAEPKSPFHTIDNPPNKWNQNAQDYLTKQAAQEQEKGNPGLAEHYHEILQDPEGMQGPASAGITSVYQKALDIHNQENGVSAGGSTTPTKPTFPFNESDMDILENHLKSQIVSPNLNQSTWNPKASDYLTDQATQELNKNYNSGMTNPTDYTYPKTYLPFLNELHEIGPDSASKLLEGTYGDPFVEKYGHQATTYNHVKNALDLHNSENGLSTNGPTPFSISKPPHAWGEKAGNYLSNEYTKAYNSPGGEEKAMYIDDVLSNPSSMHPNDQEYLKQIYQNALDIHNQEKGITPSAHPPGEDDIANDMASLLSNTTMDFSGEGDLADDMAALLSGSEPSLAQKPWTAADQAKIDYKEATTDNPPNAWSPKADEYLKDLGYHGISDSPWKVPQFSPSALKVYEKALDIHNAEQNNAFDKLSEILKKNPIGPPEAEKPYVPPTVRNDFQGPTLPHNPSGLDLSEEARMQRAKDMGANIDMPLYRGVDRNFEDHYGTWTRNNSFSDPMTKKNEPGIFSATDPRIANAYAHGDKGSSVTPLYSLAQNVKQVDWPKETGGNEDYSGHHMQRILKQALAEGHDAVHIKGIRDIGSSQPQEQYVNFNPNQLRSPFAVFDPKYKSSSNLLASRGVPLSVLQMTPVDNDPFKQK